MQQLFSMMEQTLTLTPDTELEQKSSLSPDSLTQLLSSTPAQEAARAIYEARQAFLAFHYF